MNVEFAVINSSARLADSDVAFMVAAVNDQAAACALSYGIPALPVAFYAEGSTLPALNCQIIDVVDDLDQPGALGYHTDEAGVIYGRVLAQTVRETSTTLSHEVLEALVDPTCERWAVRPDGSRVAIEVCDPVEGDSYEVDSTVLGETRRILLSNYVLPAWFVPDVAGPFDAMNRLQSPFTMDAGGYMVIDDAVGNTTDVFARRRVTTDGAASRLAMATRLGRSNSRISRRLRK